MDKIGALLAIDLTSYEGLDDILYLAVDNEMLKGLLVPDNISYLINLKFLYPIYRQYNGKKGIFRAEKLDGYSLHFFCRRL